MALARKLKGVVGTFKVGSQLFTSEGPRAVEKLAGLGFGIFLDLKFHDIPNTVGHAVAAAAKLPGVRLMTLHASNGLAGLKAAREAVGEPKNRPLLLGVTVLTSFDLATLQQIGMEGSLESRVLGAGPVGEGCGAGRRGDFGVRGAGCAADVWCRTSRSWCRGCVQPAPR